MVFERTIAYNRHRALELYIQFLKKYGVDEGQVRVSLDAMGTHPDALTLGDDLVRREILEHGLARNLRYYTRMALDHSRSSEVEKYLTRLNQTPDEGTDAKDFRRTVVLSAVVRDAVLNEAGHSATDTLQAVSELKDEAILTRTLSDAAELHPPKFPIPDWIDMSDDRCGKKIRDYRILGKIGEGGMGAVFLCDHPDRDEPIALKLLSRDADLETKQRFKREVFIQSILPDHENIIEIYDAGETDSGYGYLAMEFFDSTDLSKLLEVEKTIQPAQAVSILICIARALQAAHQEDVVHRDLKPGNMLVSRTSQSSKLADFGIALNINMGGMGQFVFKSIAGTVTGTAEYVSPEQAYGGEIDTRSDLYSLGVVLYQMLSGRLPFICENPTGYINSHILEDPHPIEEACKDLKIPKKLFDITKKLMEKEPEDRYQTTQELITELDSIAFDKSADPKDSNPLWKSLGLSRP